MILNALSYTQYQEVAPYLDTIILPVGSIQAHGPHLPLATDTFIAARIAVELDQYITGRALLLPEISYGHALAHSFSGSQDLPADVLASFIYHAVRPFHQYGAKYVVFINGNGGNIGALSMATDRLVEEGFTVLLSNWWIDARASITQIAPGIGHGGEDETSVMLSIAPQTVSLEGIEDRTGAVFSRIRYPGQFERQHPHAYSGRPSQATGVKGEQILSLIRDKLLADIQEMWKLSK